MIDIERIDRTNKIVIDLMKENEQLKSKNKELEEKLEIAKNFVLDIKTIDIIKPEVIGDIIERIK